MLGARATQERLEKVRHELRLDVPVYNRYFSYMTGLFRGDLGYSILLGRSVLDLVGHKYPVTIVIAFSAFSVSVLLGIPLGLMAGVNHTSLYDRVVMVFATLGLSIPAFWMGLNLIIIFAIWLKWLPSGGFVPFSEGFFRSIQHIILPAATLGFLSTAEIARMTRAKTLEVIREDYVTTARAKGLSEIKVIGKHVFRMW
jgi:peptide/nickel transport system permease protein